MKILALLLAVFSLRVESECLRYKGTCQADWMSELPDSVKKRPINELKILGTHDSAAYHLNLTATSNIEKDPILNFFKDLAEVNPLAKQIIKNLTLSQPLPIFEQLEQGIRALELRFLYNNQTQQFYLSHSFATVSLRHVLSEIQQFISIHKGEILVIEMADDWEHQEMTRPHNDQAIYLVKSILDSLLIPVSSSGMLPQNATIKNLVAENTRILFVFSDYLNKNHTGIWNNNVLIDRWPNGQTVNESMAVIQSYLPSLKYPTFGHLNLVYFTVTPDAVSIIKAIIDDGFGANLPDSLVDWANRMYPHAIVFINHHIANLSGLNIISVDAPSDKYIKEIINLINYLQ